MIKSGLAPDACCEAHHASGGIGPDVPPPRAHAGILVILAAVAVYTFGDLPPASPISLLIVGVVFVLGSRGFGQPDRAT